MEPARISAILRHLQASSEPASAPAPAATSAAPAAAAAPPALQSERYFTYDALTAMCEGVAAAYPTLCELGSIGGSREGRELWLLTLTDPATGPADTKPAYFIYGNIHASEPTGAHCAAYNALHLLAEEPELRKSIAVYIVPRVAVDGAEYW